MRVMPSTATLALLMALAAVAGCERYQVTVNEHPVYTPAELFTDFEVADAALARCLTQTIADRKITAAGQLRRLLCSHGDIARLDGIQRFDRLRWLDLSHNQLGSLDALFFLPDLERVDLSGNQALDCAQAQRLAGEVAGTTALPDHCTDSH